MVRPGLGRFEPLGNILARKNISLNPKRGHKEIMDRVFRSHDEFDLAADRDVEFIDFALPGSVLDLPHPLLANYIDLDEAFRRLRLLKVKLGSPKEKAHRNYEGNN
jgi:hypothetical protein